MNEQTLKTILQDTYGDLTPHRLTGGYTNDTFLLKGSQSLLIAKVASSSNDDIKNKMNCMRLLSETDIVPKAYDLIETDGARVAVMEYKEGINGQSILDGKEGAKANELYKLLGRTLAKNIHSLRPDAVSANGIHEYSIKNLNLDLDFVPENLRIKTRDQLRRLNDHSQTWVLTHGDYGVHNVLYQDGQLAILDWEWAEWGNPLTDIAWVLWFTNLHYPNQANQWLRLFLEEYRLHQRVELKSDTLQSFGVYKVCKVLQRLAQAGQDVQKEWVRRLRWTLETDIFDVYAD
ncbi:phosphotransferase family protein [Peribacillus sp. SCS-155]|uniref:phosphotransferase family protein n=1 Tax=Peribacillus sedimenti TaxID=3115297 RepID=UPI003906BF7E